MMASRMIRRSHERHHYSKFGLSVLLAVMISGYWRWVRPHTIDLETKGVLLLIIATMAGGFIGSTG